MQSKKAVGIRHRQRQAGCDRRGGRSGWKMICGCGRASILAGRWVTQKLKAQWFSSSNNITNQQNSQTEANPSVPLQFIPVKTLVPVRFDDIVGLDEPKREIQTRMILPELYPSLARLFRIRRGGGVLLYGPPGCGKSHLAAATATELRCPFFHIVPSDIMAGEVGRAEKNVAALFKAIRARDRAVVFWDELDGLAPARKSSRSTIAYRVVSQLLVELDGIASTHKNQGLLILAATNVPEMIDPALLRPGRFDTKIFVGLPESDSRRIFMERVLKSRPVAPLDMDILVAESDGLSFAALEVAVNQAADRAFRRAIKSPTEDQLLTLDDLLASLDQIRQPYDLGTATPVLCAKRLPSRAPNTQRTATMKIAGLDTVGFGLDRQS